jgi:hypothetical protein
MTVLAGPLALDVSATIILMADAAVILAIIITVRLVIVIFNVGLVVRS